MTASGPDIMVQFCHCNTVNQQESKMEMPNSGHLRIKENEFGGKEKDRRLKTNLLVA